MSLYLKKLFKLMRHNQGLGKTIIYYFAVIMTIFILSEHASALSATEILNKSKIKITSASSITADFTMKIGGQAIKGKLLSKGQKFAIISNGSSNWYNGKDLYTYNPKMKETTVFNPTAAELVEVNPLLYINSASSYDIKESKNKTAGVETVILVPKKSGGVKSVTLGIDSKTFLPKTIKIVPASGSVIELQISNIKLDGKIDNSKFEYPKSSYPNVKINDMR